MKVLIIWIDKKLNKQRKIIATIKTKILQKLYFNLPNIYIYISNF